MGDLIDRQMVIDAVLRVAQTCPAEFENSGDARMGYIAAIQSIYHEFKAISPARPDPLYCRDCYNWEQINKALSARPEVIRCRECRYKYGSACDNFAGVWVKDDDFCSRAERREVSE